MAPDDGEEEGRLVVAVGVERLSFSGVDGGELVETDSCDWTLLSLRESVWGGKEYDSWLLDGVGDGIPGAVEGWLCGSSS